MDATNATARHGKLDGEHIQVGPLEVVFLATGTQTHGHADVCEIRVPPGAAVPCAHKHVDVDEVIFGIEGEMTYVVGDAVFTLRAGDCASSPRGVVHYFSNRGAVLARSLIVATPAKIGAEYFRDVAAVQKPGAPPDLERVFAIMRSYGIEPAPMPAAVATPTPMTGR